MIWREPTKRRKTARKKLKLRTLDSLANSRNRRKNLKKWFMMTHLSFKTSTQKHLPKNKRKSLRNSPKSWRLLKLKCLKRSLMSSPKPAKKVKSLNRVEKAAKVKVKANKIQKMKALAWASWM